MNYAIVSLAAGASQLPAIKKAGSLGYKVIAVDRNPESPGFSLADECLYLSTYEAGPILEALEPLKSKYEIKGIINRSLGAPVITAAHLLESLNLPGPSVKASESIVNKHILYQFH